MLSVKAREATDTIFKVFGMTQPRIKSSLPCFAGERSGVITALGLMLLRFYSPAALRVNLIFYFGIL